MRLRGVSLIALCHVGVLLGSAAADDKTGKQKRADELFEEGRTILAKGDADGACDKFNEAIKLDPEAPGTMLNLGLCNEMRFKYKTALYWFRKAQARAAESQMTAYEDAAKQHTYDLKNNKVATIKITFKSGTAPDGTRVKIDGDEVAPADYLAAEVDPGDHTLVAGAPGFKNSSQTFSIAKESRGGQTLTIDLVAGENSVVVDRGAGRRKAAYITAAGGGVLLLASLGVSLYAKSKYDKCTTDKGMLDPTKLGDPCPETDPGKATDYANSAQELAQNWGTGLFVTGAVAVGVAAYLYFTAPDKERVDQTVFAPTFGPDQVGFSASGRF